MNTIVKSTGISFTLTHKIEFFIKKKLIKEIEMSTYKSEYDVYDDPDGYIVFDIVDNINYWFRTYTEMRDSFGESVIWDHENETYIIQHEEVEEIIERMIPERY